MARVILWSSDYDPYSNNSQKIYKRKMIMIEVIYMLSTSKRGYDLIDSVD